MKTFPKKRKQLGRKREEDKQRPLTVKVKTPRFDDYYRHIMNLTKRAEQTPLDEEAET